jgi:hypothetical protein
VQTWLHRAREMPKEEYKQESRRRFEEGNSYFEPYRSQAHPSKLARTAVMRWPANSSQHQWKVCKKLHIIVNLRFALQL